MHTPGCSQQLGSDPLTLKRIWYTKAKALLSCIKATKDDVLLVDLDAILVRDPTSTFFSSSSSRFDIISSRDHGPERLMHGKHWGLWRLCAGLVLYRYSPHLVDFLENVLVRVDRLGNDQHQLNLFLSLTGLVWDEHRDTQHATGASDAHGAFLWPRPLPRSDLLAPGFAASDRRWKVSSEAQKQMLHEDLVKWPKGRLIKGAEVERREMTVRLVRLDVLQRYCHTFPSTTMARYHSVSASASAHASAAWAGSAPGLRTLDNMVPLDGSNISSSLVALHCFYNDGPVQEQGIQKMALKTRIMRRLKTWLLKPELDHTSAPPKAWAASASASDMGVVDVAGPNLALGRHHPANAAFLAEFADKGRVAEMKRVWIERAGGGRDQRDGKG